LANTVGPEIQIVENVVRVKAVRRGGSAGTHQKAGSLGGHIWKVCQPGSKVRSRHRHHGIGLFSIEGT